jgi:hypothetical protein
MHAHRLLVEHGEIHPAPAHLIRGGVGELAHVGAVDGEHCSDARFVVDLHEKRAPALFHQLSLGVALLHLHARLGINVDPNEAVLVEELLKLLDLTRPARAGIEDSLDLRGFGGGQRLSQQVERLHHARNLRGEGLEVNFGYQRQLFGGEGEGAKREGDR